MISWDAMPGDVEGVLREGIKEYDVRLVRLRLIDVPQGADNLNIPFSCEDGRFVFRCYKVTPRDEIPFELEVITALHRSGFPTPGVLQTRSGALLCDTREGPAALFEFVDGKLMDPYAPDSLKKAAELLACLHHRTQDMQVTGPRKRSRTDIGRIQRLQRMLEGIKGIAGEADLRELVRLACETAEAYRACSEKGEARLPFGVIHHDPNCSNILVDGRGEVAALLDFDEAHESHLILDVAAFLQYWCYDLEHGLDVAAAAEAIGYYHRLRPLTHEEMDCLRSAILLNLAADASDYLAGRIVAGDTGVSVHSCHSYRRFSALLATPDWETYVLRRADD
jgi:Ser/Thr protein kinase RdoA (MazF antagonist)